MVACAEKRPLRDANVVSDGDVIEIKQPTILAQPNMIAQSKFPRKSDFHMWLYDHTPANFRSEGPQNIPFQRGKCERTKLEKEQVYEQPCALLHDTGATIKPAGRIL